MCVQGVREARVRCAQCQCPQWPVCNSEWLNAVCALATAVWSLVLHNFARTRILCDVSVAGAAPPERRVCMCAPSSEVSIRDGGMRRIRSSDASKRGSAISSASVLRSGRGSVAPARPRQEPTQQTATKPAPGTRSQNHPPAALAFL